MDINKAYKFRFYPTEEQAEILARTFGCARKVYNDALDTRQRIYKEHGENISYYQLDHCHGLAVFCKSERGFRAVQDTISPQSPTA